MASLDDLQDELVRQSSRRLEAEHERTRLEEQVRKLLRDNASLRDEHEAAHARVTEMESEMADLSSSLVEQANVQVAEANRKVASAQKLVAERDLLLEIHASQLQEIKHMMEQQEEAARGTAGSTPRGPKRGRRSSFVGELDADAILDLDSYASPVRPLLRFDTREFREFREIFPVEGAARAFHFSLEALEAPAWRRSRFVSRLITEEIEPTLRLDRAAHMNWLTCRAFLAGVLDQTLLLEPVSAKERPWAHRPSHPCLLCGENRTEPIYSRYFWARTTPEAEPLVLDLACLAKVRLACEMVAFLRGITDGKPGASREQQEQAWRECTSLREQLFWARTGGFYPDPDSAHTLPSSAHALEKMPLSVANTPALSQAGFSNPSTPAAASPASHARADSHTPQHRELLSRPAAHLQSPTPNQSAAAVPAAVPPPTPPHRRELPGGREESPAERGDSPHSVDRTARTLVEKLQNAKIGRGPSSTELTTPANPAVKSAAKPVVEPIVEPAVEPIVEPAAEPAAELAGTESAADPPAEHDSESDFHFDDAQEFHPADESPAHRAQDTSTEASNPSEAISPREHIPGGWPG